MYPLSGISMQLHSSCRCTSVTQLQEELLHGTHKTQRVCTRDFARDTRQITRQQLAQTKMKEPFRGRFQTLNKKTKHSHKWGTIAQGRCGGGRVVCQHRRKSSNFTPPQPPHHIALGKQGREAMGKCPSQQ